MSFRYTPQEAITDEILSYKNNAHITRDFIIKNLINGNDIIYDNEDKLVIRLIKKNKTIMSKKWCITSSDKYFSQYNSDGNEQYIYYNFKTNDHIGFNLNNKEISHGYDWDNSPCNHEKILLILKKIK
jgi:hypothetical protein